MSALENAYERQVRGWIASAVAGGETDLSSLIEGLPGVDPIYVVQVLGHLLATDCDGAMRRLYEQAKSTRGAAKSVTRFTFVPHPLDFDWRFTAESASAIVDHVLRRSAGTRFTLLGTPTLVSAIHTRCPSAQILLLDKNPMWGTQLGSCAPGVHFSTCDLTTDNPHLERGRTIDVVIADPPWYPTIQQAYLWVAAKLTRPGGYVVTTVAPLGTRPGIAEEREAMERFTCSLGLQMIELSERAVRYRSSPFELNAMKAAGIHLSLPEWRRGDLMVLRSEQPNHADRPPVQNSDSDWTEVVIGGVRIKVRTQADASSKAALSPELVSIVENDVLPSVSNRHKLRSEVDVWTSGNRIFKCRNTQGFLQLCASLSNNGRVAAALAAAPMEIERAREQLIALVTTEAREYLPGS